MRLEIDKCSLKWTDRAGFAMVTGMKKSDPPKLIKGYEWIVYHPDLLGGKPTVRGTRISVAQVLECLAAGMTPAEIADDYPGFPAEAVPDVLKYAAEQLHKPLKKQPGVAA